MSYAQHMKHWQNHHKGKKAQPIVLGQFSLLPCDCALVPMSHKSGRPELTTHLLCLRCGRKQELNGAWVETFVPYPTDFSKSAEDKLVRMGAVNGIYRFPFATEYREQGKERKHHVFMLVDGKITTYHTSWFPVPIQPTLL